MKLISGEKGFSMIELMIALLILSLVISAAVLTTKHVRNRATLCLFETDIRIVKQAAERFEMDCGFYPPDVYRGVDPGLVEQYGWMKGSHSSVWETLDMSGWKGPYLKNWKRNPWGGLYDWDNYPSNYTAWGIPGGGVYLTLKPSTWGGKDGLPPQDFEDLLEYLELDVSKQSQVVAIWMGSEPIWSVPGVR